MDPRPNTVAGLIELHREIAGQIEATRQTMNRLVADLEAVEHTLRLFNPDAEIPRAKPLPSQNQAFRGEMRRLVLSALRAADRPLTNLEIARQVVAIRKLGDDPKTVVVMRKRVGAALWKLKQLCWAVEVPQEGDYKGWRSA